MKIASTPRLIQTDRLLIVRMLQIFQLRTSRSDLSRAMIERTSRPCFTNRFYAAQTRTGSEPFVAEKETRPPLSQNEPGFVSVIRVGQGTDPRTHSPARSA